jgi:L-ascorbate metabolism protein UlaG (beta-lactamase superfamily)
VTVPGDRADGIVYVGHATTLIELDGNRLLTDPVLGPRIGHITRRVPLPDAAHVAALVAVLLSHAHYDHLDVASLRRVAGGGRLVVPRGVGKLLARRRITATDEVEAGAALTIGSLVVSVVHAEHDGRRWPGGIRYPSVGYVVEGGGRRIYFAGDTDLFDGMRDLRDIDVALLPICGWGVRVGPGHLNPERAAEAVARIGPRIAMPIHWGTLASPSYAATDLSEPARRFAELTAEAAPEVEVVVVAPGGRLELGLRARR